MSFDPPVIPIGEHDGHEIVVSNFDDAPFYVNATRIRERWRGVCRWLAWPMPPQDPTAPIKVSKVHGGGWSPCWYRGDYREMKNVERCSALALDLDDRHYPADEVVAAFNELELEAFIHTTAQSSALYTRWRAVVPFLEPVGLADADKAWTAVAVVLRKRRIIPSPLAQDTGRVCYAPLLVPGFEWRRIHGELLDVARIPAIPPPPPKRVRPSPRSVPRNGREQYARAALDRAAENVASTGEGRRNDVLFFEACAVRRFVDERSLPGAEYERALVQAAQLCGLSECEALTTIASARRTRKKA